MKQVDGHRFDRFLATRSMTDSENSDGTPGIAQGFGGKDVREVQETGSVRRLVGVGDELALNREATQQTQSSVPA